MGSDKEQANAASIRPGLSLFILGTGCRASTRGHNKRSDSCG